MAISQKILIQVAPFDDETRADILKNLNQNTLDDDQKQQLNALCWELITKLYESEIAFRFERMHQEEMENNKSFTPEDYTGEKAKIILKFAEKLGSASSAEEITEVRKALEIHSTKNK